jgi:Na+-driven multidrug efflux pump
MLLRLNLAVFLQLLLFWLHLLQLEELLRLLLGAHLKTMLGGMKYFRGMTLDMLMIMWRLPRQSGKRLPRGR